MTILKSFKSNTVQAITPIIHQGNTYKAAFIRVPKALDLYFYMGELYEAVGNERREVVVYIKD